MVSFRIVGTWHTYLSLSLFWLVLYSICVAEAWGSSRVISRSNLRPTCSKRSYCSTDCWPAWSFVSPPPSFVLPQSWILNFCPRPHHLLGIISSRLDNPALQRYDFLSETALRSSWKHRLVAAVDHSIIARPVVHPYLCELAFNRLRPHFRLEKADAILSIFRVASPSPSRGWFLSK